MYEVCEFVKNAIKKEFKYPAFSGINVVVILPLLRCNSQAMRVRS